MRIFGGEQIGSVMDRLNLPEDQPIENRLVSRAIEQAQVKVEGFHFDARKNLVEYDDVANQQREIVYKLRRRILESKNVKDEILEKLFHRVDNILLTSTSVDNREIDEEKVVIGLLDIVPFDEASRDRIKGEIKKRKDNEEVKKLLYKVVEDVQIAREKEMGETVMRQIEKFAYLGAIDKEWIDHIDQIDGLREGVRLRGYAQRDPIAEFKNEAYSIFEGLLDRIDDELSRRIFRISVARPQPEIPLESATTNVDTTDATGLMEVATAELGAEKGQPAFSELGKLTASMGQSTSTGKVPLSGNASDGKKLGRNDPCWCGSGKKWKKCHYPQYGNNV
jgi:preprotein translocase subunit SecA